MVERAKEERKEAIVPKSNTKSNINMAKPLIFNRKKIKVLGFLIAYKLYIRVRMRGTSVEKQIQWLLSYIQRGLTNIWKKNILEDLEFAIVEDFLTKLKKEFDGGNNETMKVAEF